MRSNISQPARKQVAVRMVASCETGAMPPKTSGNDRPIRASSARTKALGSLITGLVVGGASVPLGAGRAAPLIGWDVLALTFCSWVWATIWPLDPLETARHAKRENPGRDLADIVLLAAAIASLIAVGVVLFSAGNANGNDKYVQAGFALASVFISWVLIHTVFTLKYALHYYTDPAGGIDFNEDDKPDYRDFAYLAFTIGMTFQVSDTNIQTKPIRRTALRHALISFPLGAVIIATSINLVSGLAK
jgi:uncharacterized membrane protein